MPVILGEEVYQLALYISKPKLESEAFLIRACALPLQISSPDEGYESKSLYESWLEKDRSLDDDDQPR